MSDKPLQSNLDPSDSEAVVQTVRERYAGIANTGSSCCGSNGGACGGTAEAVATNLGYARVDLDLLPEGANLGLGCGAPLQHLELEEGEAFLDLGSGAGIDALIAARQVGPTGRVIGVDMTPVMLAKARENAAGHDNVEFREGRLEALPVDDASVDAVTSNCVINLVPERYRTTSSPMSAAWPAPRSGNPTSRSSPMQGSPISRFSRTWTSWK